ncbi:hypothetical protein [Methylibium sp.]|uniref:hypothetical protein n=1 Tax=Methylibium sp. TaxID=2067992 RepID=UPI003D0BED3F
MKRLLVWNAIGSLLTAALASSACLATELTPTEQRWLKGAWPVVAFAREARLPLDIVVQPQPAPGAAPLALAFVDGRCKLVLSMRGNAEAQDTLERTEPDLLDATLELMAAHELGHCRRYLDGAWQRLPAGFGAASVPGELDPELQAAYADMQALRREEGYADLVGLAWARQQHPQLYARLHAWLVAERSRELIPGSHHDTLAWVRLAAHADASGPASIFAGSAALWAAGLAAGE